MEKINYFDESTSTREQLIESLKIVILKQSKQWQRVKIQDIWYSYCDKCWKLTGYYNGKA